MKRIAILLFLLVAAAALAQESKPAPGLTLEAVKVDPASPGPDKLCKLSVTVKNAGAKTASALGFRVKVDGKELAVYGKELFFRPVPAGSTTEIKLHNFWSSETGRPFPASGRMTVEVTLAEARWMDVKTENGAEVWTPVGAVEGLPVSKSVTLMLAKR
ncbi:MAG TPA: hypothetical protein VH394_12715 [Thermoanaerobaculia bacterium]|jgi:hypothetical protein|nr:hypothetical protein [Thermoanaerobaculia bacterium]